MTEKEIIAALMALIAEAGEAGEDHRIEAALIAVQLVGKAQNLGLEEMLFEALDAAGIDPDFGDEEA